MGIFVLTLGFREVCVTKWSKFGKMPSRVILLIILVKVGGPIGERSVVRSVAE